MTNRAEEYRRYARQCVAIAPTFQDQEARATLLGLAQAWLRLAHLALANRQIAELAVQIARQRVIVKYALDTGEIAPELTGHGLPLSKCEAYNRVYDQFYRSR